MKIDIPGPSLNSDYSPLYENPLAFIKAARMEYGDLIAFSQETSLFSKVQDCKGSVGVFGVQNVKEVLSNVEVFGSGMLTKKEPLSLELSNLRSGLFSMEGGEHRQQKQGLLKAFSSKQVTKYSNVIIAKRKEFFDEWKINSEIDLLTEMRRLGLCIFDEVIFGSGIVGQPYIGNGIQYLLQLRRVIMRTDSVYRIKAIENEIIVISKQIDLAIRRLVSAFRADASLDTSSCILGCLSTIKNGKNFLLSTDELIAHTHTFFLAGCEPFAVSLSWTILLLSRFPVIRSTLRKEIIGSNYHQLNPNLAMPDLLENVIKESMRLLPPNALMVRVTKEATRLGGYNLPKNMEVLIFPFVAHRAPSHFPSPNEFIPERWTNLKLSSFEYLPFGAGPKSCLGKILTMNAMKRSLAHLIQHFDLNLAADQAINWQLDITLMPENKIEMKIETPSTSTHRKEKITGSLIDLVPFI